MLDETVQFKLSANDFLQQVPKSELLDPNSPQFEPHRRSAFEGGYSILPAITFQFTDFDYKATPSYGFGMDDLLTWVIYSSSFQNMQQEEYRALLKQILTTIFAQYPTSAVGGKEYLDTFETMNLETEAIRVDWLSEDNTFMRVDSAYLSDTYVLTITVGLQT